VVTTHEVFGHEVSRSRAIASRLDRKTALNSPLNHYKAVHLTNKLSLRTYEGLQAAYSFLGARDSFYSEKLLVTEIIQ